MRRHNYCIALSLFLLVCVAKTSAAPQFLTNQSDFASAISGGISFTTNLSFPLGDLASPVLFSGGGLSVEALSTNTNAYSLYSFGNNLTINQNDDFGLLFTNFSPNAFAFGGLFFNVEPEGPFIANNLIFNVVFADLSSISTNILSASTNEFFAFVGATNLLSVLVTTEPGTPEGGFPATSQLTIGSPVPEPSTVALLLLSSAALAGYAIRRRKQ